MTNQGMHLETTWRRGIHLKEPKPFFVCANHALLVVFTKNLEPVFHDEYFAYALEEPNNCILTIPQLPLTELSCLNFSKNLVTVALHFSKNLVTICLAL